MSGTDILSPAAQKVCRELTPLLQNYAQEFGLAPELAKTLWLHWDGEDFSARSDQRLDDAEFGTGKGPAPRPVHKALRRLELDAEGLLTEMLQDSVVRLAESARF